MAREKHVSPTKHRINARPCLHLHITSSPLSTTGVENIGAHERHILFEQTLCQPDRNHEKRGEFTFEKQVGGPVMNVQWRPSTPTPPAILFSGFGPGHAIKEREPSFSQMIIAVTGLLNSPDTADQSYLPQPLCCIVS